MERDWSSLAYLVVALVLVTSPFWLFPHAGEEVRTYQAYEIRHESDSQNHLRARGQFARLDCYELRKFEQGCLLAAYVAQNGPITVNSTSFGRRYDTGTEYVVVEDDMTEAPFYRRVVNKTDTKVTYSLEQVSPAAILRNVSVDESDVSPKVRRAIDGETVRTYDESLPEAGAVVRSNGTYYSIVERYYGKTERSGLEATLWRAVTFVVGLLMLRRRWRGGTTRRSKFER